MAKNPVRPGSTKIRLLSILTGHLAALAVTGAKIAAATITPDKAAVITGDSAAGGLPFFIQVDLDGAADGATENTDVTVTIKAQIIAAWVVLLGAGTASDTIQILSTANAITEALDISAGTDHLKMDFTTFDNAYSELAVDDVLRVAQVDGGSADCPAATVYIQLLPVA